jgi:RNA polymerase sigma factor (sigma-70 family)
VVVGGDRPEGDVTESSGTLAGGEDELLIEIWKLAHRFARQEMRERADAEDLGQDVVLECLEKIRAGRWDTLREGVPALVKWLVRHRAINVRRNRRRHYRGDTDYLRQHSTSRHAWMYPDLALGTREMAALHGRALSILSPACRRAYLLVRGQGMSYVDVATQLGVKRSTVNRHVATAHGRIKAMLERAGVSTVGRRSVGRRAKQATRDSSRVLG